MPPNEHRRRTRRKADSQNSDTKNYIKGAIVGGSTGAISSIMKDGITHGVSHLHNNVIKNIKIHPGIANTIRHFKPRV